MNLSALAKRNFIFHWRSHLAVVLGVVTGTATLTGALWVGDSMRASLRAAALDRLGNVSAALVSSRFFRAELAGEIGRDSRSKPAEILPAISLRGAVTHADSRARADGVGVIGCTPGFWRLQAEPPSNAEPADAPMPVTLTGSEAIVNAQLADEIGARVGDEVLLRIGKPSQVSTATALGRRDDTTATLRLTIRQIVPADGIGAFTLNPAQQTRANIFLPLETLQERVGRPGRINTLLVGNPPDAVPLNEPATVHLNTALAEHVALEDYGLRLRRDLEQRCVVLESERFLLEPLFAEAAARTADALRLETAGVLAYLANEIRPAAERPTGVGRTVPYSAVAAVAPQLFARGGFVRPDGTPATAPQPGEIVLNDWTAGQLGVRTGDRVVLTFYVSAAFGDLREHEQAFTVSDVVALRYAAADPGLVPEYPGVTDAETLGDWDPPFPMDLGRIRGADEEYWERHATTPKALLSLVEGQQLWTQHAARLGQLTSVRFYPDHAGNPDAASGRISTEFLRQIPPEAAGFTFQDVRSRALAASGGSTDFGGLFIGFSMFLILSSAMLVALLFRLGAERRSREIGLLLAVGYDSQSVSRLLLREGAIVAMVGALAGLPAALAYAWLMLAGLRTWWSAAVQASFLELHTTAASWIIGLLAGVLVALCSLAWSLRGLTRRPPRPMLAGVTATVERSPRRVGRVSLLVAVVCFLLGGVLVLLPFAGAAAASGAFFAGGAALLAGCLALLKSFFGRRGSRQVHRPGPAALVVLGVRNAPRRPGRSLLTIGLVASATFLIAAIQAFRLEAGPAAGEKYSGTGGFVLYAEAAAPLPYDFDTPAGRRQLAFRAPEDPVFEAVTVVPFRLRPGDETSCQNLYLPTQPRILGAPHALIERGGFEFAGFLPVPGETGESANPWRLLGHEFADGAIAVIGDEAAVRWQLHSNLGDDLVIQDEAGRDVHLRFVALLSGSMLQSELIVSETDFARLFPSIEGHAFFLVDAPRQNLAPLQAQLERELERFGLDVRSSTDRLNGYLAIQNTYLSAFQILGGLGLVLGTFGLAVVLLRNVWERRGELALLTALGFSRSALRVIVLAENAALVVAGLAIGFAAAMLAVAPHLAARPGTIPWSSLGLILGLVLAVGIGAGALALVPALRGPLVRTLRNE